MNSTQQFLEANKEYLDYQIFLQINYLLLSLLSVAAMGYLTVLVWRYVKRVVRDDDMLVFCIVPAFTFVICIGVATENYAKLAQAYLEPAVFIHERQYEDRYNKIKQLQGEIDRSCEEHQTDLCKHIKEELRRTQ